LGCERESNVSQGFEGKIDSLKKHHSLVLDSLNHTIEDQQFRLEEIQNLNQTLRDSIKNIPNQGKQPRKLQKRPIGDPIRDGEIGKN
jgi:hypothetical protein